ncbi:MAG TPA: hypothetical protein VFW77_03530 [Candidatus Saccharimonadales bacterium]|nr:hypothetical protein [Candidatus Saccharimonadales bacterium]
MSEAISSIDKVHGTRKGKLVFGAIELIASYLVVSRAIDTGSLWEWLIGALLFIGAVNNFLKSIFHRNGGAKKDAKGRAKRK